MNYGIVIVAYGYNAHVAATKCIESIRKVCKIPIAIITDSLEAMGTRSIFYDDNSYGARWAKLNQDMLTSFDFTLYIDADTTVHGNITKPFDIIAHGWDIAMSCSKNQEKAAFRHVSSDERMRTYNEIGIFAPLQFQAGVMYWRSNKKTHALFREWRRQWKRWQQQDQAALVRAIENVKPRIWILGHPYNDQNGEIIQHHFGRAR